MAGIKITDLDSALTAPADSDILVIVDVSENKTKQITLDLLLSAVSGVSASSVSVSAKDDNVTYYLNFTNTDNGTASLYADNDLNYNALTNTLTAGAFSGDGVNLTGVLADSALNATNIVVSTITSGTVYPTFASSTGLQVLKTDTGISFDASTNTLTTSIFSGAFTGNGSGLTNLPLGGGGSIASTVNVVPSSLNSTHYVMFSASSSGVDSVNTDAELTYNPNTNTLSAGTFSGAFSGNGSALTGITVSFADSAGVTGQLKLVSTTSTDTTTYPVLVGTSGTTAQTVFIDNASLSYNASTNTLSSGFFEGDGSLLTNVTADLISATTTSAAGTFYVMLRDTSTGDDSVKVATTLSYNPSTGSLTATSFSGIGSSLTDIAAETIAANAASVGTYYPMIRGAATGDDSVHTHSSFTYNVGTATLAATYFIGDGSNITNVAASTATTATNSNNVAVTSVSTNANFYVHFGSASSGNDGVDVDVDLLYNPSTNILRIDADNGKLILGEDSDIEYYHSGTHGYIDVNTGSLYIRDNLDSVHSLFDMTTGNLHVEGNVIAFSTTIVSDPKFKYNIQPITNSLSKVSELNGVSWKWKTSGLPSAGVISTDVKKVLLEAVKLQTELNSTEQFEAVNYDAIVGLLVEAVKELKKEVEELKSRL